MDVTTGERVVLFLCLVFFARGIDATEVDKMDAQMPSGLYLWYKADVITDLRDGDPVSVWPDSGPHHMDLYRHSGEAPFVQPPTFQQRSLGQLPTLRFEENSPTGLRSRKSLSGLAGDPSLTLLVAGRISKPQVPNVLLFGWGASTWHGGKQILLELAQGRFRLGTGWEKDALTPEDAFASYFGKGLILLCAKASGPLAARTEITFNGYPVAVTGSDMVPDVTATPLSMGADPTVGWGYVSPQMDLAEVVVFDRLLDARERHQIGYYLQTKYGIDGNYQDPQRLAMKRLRLTAEPSGAVAGLQRAGERHYLFGTEVPIEAAKRVILDGPQGSQPYEFHHWQGKVVDPQAGQTKVKVDASQTVTAVFKPAKPVIFYVATTGKDDWSGTLPAANAAGTDGPFASLGRARDAVRAMRGYGALREPVTIAVRGGKYHLSEPLRLGRQDSGTKENQVTFTAFPGEMPVISGGRRLTDWQPYRGEILKCDVPATKGGTWRFRQLFLDGKRQIRARYPNLERTANVWRGRWALSELDDKALEEQYILWKEEGAFPHAWAKPTEGEIVCHPRRFLWGDMAIIRITSVDPQKRRIHLEHGLRDFDLNPHFFPTEVRRPEYCQFIVENLLEELDEPGEWCLDAEDGVVYFWPPQEMPADAEVVVPFTKTLVHLHGATHIHISGLTFTETLGGEPSTHYIDVEGIGAPQAQPGWDYCGEAMYLSKCQNCVVQGNKFLGIGGNGIYLRHHNRENIIRGNEIGYAGANGVVLAGCQVDLWSGLSLDPYPVATEVTDNVIHHCGVYDSYSAGIALGLCKKNLIAHNKIHDVPHYGINLGNSRLSRNVVERNLILRASQVAAESAAINCWHEVPPEIEPAGHTIRYNLVTDTGGKHAWLAAALYLDNFSSNCHIYGNIFANSSAQHTGLHANLAGLGIFVRGRNNLIENNILVGGPSTRNLVFLVDAQTGNVMRRNIMYTVPGANKGFIDIKIQPQMGEILVESDNNVYFELGVSDPIMTKGFSVAQWRQKFGSEERPYDVHSVVANPQFVDISRGDYRLRPDSPAWKLGFQPIDISSIGPRCEFSPKK